MRRLECPVCSNNSAHRGTPDVPMIIPEINADHAEIIHGTAQAPRHKARFHRGQVQLLDPVLCSGSAPLLMNVWTDRAFLVCTYQAISGAGKTFETWPEMVDNVIPYIGGEEEKSEQEPMKIWGHIEGDQIVTGDCPGHHRAVPARCLSPTVTWLRHSVKFKNKPSMEVMIERWNQLQGAARRS